MLEKRKYTRQELIDLFKTSRLDAIQNKIRRATSEKKEEYRAEKAKVTEVITALRKRRKLAIAIEERSIRIDTALEQLMANEENTRRSAQIHYERQFTR